jgi:hypothetical protein
MTVTLGRTAVKRSVATVMLQQPEPLLQLTMMTTTMEIERMVLL